MTHRMLPVLVAVLAVGCGRAAPETLEPYVSEDHGFTVARPSGWHRAETDGGRRVWFLPRPPATGDPETEATEFIVVMTLAQPGPLPEIEVRRLAMTLLPMHGVSGFVRTPASTDQVAWYRFELTGSTRGSEWASLGLLVSGPRRLHYVVCAGPLVTWREGQKRCDDVLKSFRPGDLSR
ncbi:MAG: hypothetical protein QN120_10180 [Armatimonadota bacterium]|nr:hypothetical protein [Armatimonadota bacterium]